MTVNKLKAFIVIFSLLIVQTVFAKSPSADCSEIGAWDEVYNTCIINNDVNLTVGDTWDIGGDSNSPRLTIQSGVTLTVPSGVIIMGSGGIKIEGTLENNGIVDVEIQFKLPTGNYTGSGVLSPTKIGLYGTIDTDVTLTQFGPSNLNYWIMLDEMLEIKPGGSLSIPANYRFINGGTLLVDDTATLTVETDGIAQNEATINNGGEIINKGELYNKLTGTITGTTTAQGITNQLTFYNLGSVNLTGTLQNSGAIENGWRNGEVNANATIAVGANSYIVNTGTMSNRSIITLATPSGSIENNSTLTNIGTIDVGTGNDTSKSYITTNANGTTQNNGTINLLRGVIDIKDSATFKNYYLLNISNNGLINNESTYSNMGNSAILSSDGRIQNSSLFTNDGSSTIENNGTILSDSGGVFNNVATFNNNYGASLQNGSTFENSGTLNNEYGNITNEGRLINSGTINNSAITVPTLGIIENLGTLTNTTSGSINNSDTIINYATLINDGTITNDNTINNLTGSTLDTSGTFLNNLTYTVSCLSTHSGVVSNIALASDCSDTTVASVIENSPFSYSFTAEDDQVALTNWRVKSGTTLPSWLTVSSETLVSTLGTAALFANPQGVAVDGSGNVYVADTDNHKILKITPARVVTTLAGSTRGSVDGTGTAALFNSPQGITVDGSGNLYVADSGNNRIRKITPAGVVTTLAGSRYGFADGTGTTARFDSPRAVAVDDSGNLYVADTNNNRIRKITPAGVVTTLAGDTWGHVGSVDGTGSDALFNSPQGITVDGGGNVYVADTSNHKIRKITPAGVVTTLAGRVPGFADGTGTAAEFYRPLGMSVDDGGNLYVADGNNRIRKITPAGVVTTLAGSTQGSIDGTGTDAKFYSPAGITVDGGGNVYVADTFNDSIRKITPVGVVTTLAGGAWGSTYGTGPAVWQFELPKGVTADSNGNVYVADTDNHKIRKITPAGVVTTLAGSTQGFADGTGTAAKFNNPRGITVDGDGNVYVADTFNDRIRKITPAGVVTTLAGSTQGFADATGTAARFYFPNGVTVDGGGNVYVADTSNQKIRKITPAGVVTTLAGSTYGFADGTGTAAKFFTPRGITVDGDGNLYVADTFNDKIRKITPAGVVTTLAGSTAGENDGTGTAAKFNYPSGVSVDGSGNVYVADMNNHRIRKITSAGVVTTLAGSGYGSVDGTGTAAKFYSPLGVSVDGRGNLYVADTNNHKIRKISTYTTISGTPTNADLGINAIYLTRSDGVNVVEHNFKITVNALDVTPDAVSFTALTSQPRGTFLDSQTVVITGIGNNVPISITGGEYSTNYGYWRTTAGTINNNESVTIRQISSASYSTTATAYLTIGDTTLSFEITTKRDTYVLINPGAVVTGYDSAAAGSTVTDAGTGVSTTVVNSVKTADGSAQTIEMHTRVTPIVTTNADGVKLDTSATLADGTQTATSVQVFTNGTTRTTTTVTPPSGVSITNTVQSLMQCSQINVEEDGSVALTFQVTDAASSTDGFTYEAVVTSDKDGNTKTKFVKTNIATGVANTLSANSSYEPGSTTEIKSIGPRVFIMTTATLNKNLVIR